MSRASRYSPEVRERAVADGARARERREVVSGVRSCSISEKFGCTAETTASMGSTERARHGAAARSDD